MEYVLGQTQRTTTEAQTGGACIYGASLFVRHFSLSMAYAGKDKTANCHSFDTTRTLTEQKSGSKVILRDNLARESRVFKWVPRTFGSACKLSSEKAENWVFTASLGLLYSLAPDKKPVPPAANPRHRGSLLHASLL